jgi:hypothetical protein
MIIISTGLGFPTSRILFAHVNPGTVTETSPKVNKKPLEMAAPGQREFESIGRKNISKGFWKEERNA